MSALKLAHPTRPLYRRHGPYKRANCHPIRTGQSTLPLAESLPQSPLRRCEKISDPVGVTTVATPAVLLTWKSVAPDRSGHRSSRSSAARSAEGSEGVKELEDRQINVAAPLPHLRCQQCGRAARDSALGRLDSPIFSHFLCLLGWGLLFSFPRLRRRATKGPSRAQLSRTWLAGASPWFGPPPSLA